MMKKNVILLLVGLGALCACHEDFADRCTREAKEFTAKQCPKVVDTIGVRIDSMVYNRATNTKTEFYTLTGRMDNEEMVNSAREQFTEVMKETIKNSIDLKMYKEHELTFAFIYISEKTGETRLKFAVTPKDYNTGETR